MAISFAVAPRPPCRRLRRVRVEMVAFAGGEWAAITTHIGALRRILFTSMPLWG